MSWKGRECPPRRGSLKAWVVICPERGALLWTGSAGRNTAIDTFIRTVGGDWQEYYRKNYRCRRITISWEAL